jgi:hypothetical protein
LGATFYELDANPPVPYYQRGWLTKSVTPARSTGFNYYSPGGAVANIFATDGSTTYSSADSATNYAAPQTITTQTYSETIGYNSWLGITQTTGKNGEQLWITYDNAGRPPAARLPMARSPATHTQHPAYCPCSR